MVRRPRQANKSQTGEQSRNPINGWHRARKKEASEPSGYEYRSGSTYKLQKVAALTVYSSQAGEPLSSNFNDWMHGMERGRKHPRSFTTRLLYSTGRLYPS